MRLPLLKACVSFMLNRHLTRTTAERLSQGTVDESRGEPSCFELSRSGAQ